MKWWLSTGGPAEGPFPEEHVKEWIRTGQISAETLVCPEGGQEWRKVREVGGFAGYVTSAAGSANPQTLAPSSSAASPSGVRRTSFGILTATIVLSACSIALELLTVADITGTSLPSYIYMIVSIVGIVTWSIYHYRLWQLLPDQVAETTPGKAVGLMFVPGFNLYWVFRSHQGVNRGLNRLIDANRVSGPRASVGLATAHSVLFIWTWVFVVIGLITLPDASILTDPSAFSSEQEWQTTYEYVSSEHVAFNLLLLSLVSVPGFIVWLLLVLNQAKVVERLLAHDVAVNESSGLIAR